jgi:hypothetical protein
MTDAFFGEAGWWARGTVTDVLKLDLVVMSYFRNVFTASTRTWGFFSRGGGYVVLVGFSVGGFSWWIWVAVEKSFEDGSCRHESLSNSPSEAGARIHTSTS